MNEEKNAFDNENKTQGSENWMRGSVSRMRANERHSVWIEICGSENAT